MDKVDKVSTGLFTIIIDVFYGKELFSISLDSILQQSYNNLEVIVVSNGADSEIISYIKTMESIDSRIKTIFFENNQFSYSDPLMMIDKCYNSALAVATGEYIWYQSYDDVIGVDFIQRMVNLFQNNSGCTSAAGRAVSMDVEGNIDNKELKYRESNYRPKYMPGHILALDALSGGKTLFSAPGTIFSFRRKLLVESGGYNRSVEISQLYGIVPFGITGYDSEAILYWRRHDSQLNVKLTSLGWSSVSDTLNMIVDYKIEEKWRHSFGNDLAKYVVKAINMDACKTAAADFSRNVFNFRLSFNIPIIKKCYKLIWFWKYLPREMMYKTKITVINLIQRILNYMSK